LTECTDGEGHHWRYIACDDNTELYHCRKCGKEILT
jgi:predicted RNA-binding Zn-ribbon protein involved in translation (DUF1610 family)